MARTLVHTPPTPNNSRHLNSGEGEQHKHTLEAVCTDKRMLMDPLALRLSSNTVRRRSQAQLFVGNCQIFMSHVDQTGQKSI